jgi:hypothetical protein
MNDMESPDKTVAQLAEEINAMCSIDQDMRERNLESGDEYWDEDVDARNTRRMKEIVQSIGWPTISKVGSETASNAWLLVQHADHDVDFQEHCLSLMKESNEGDVDKHNIAYLEDRIRINQGRGQIYGTQFKQEDVQHIPLPIEDEENVDSRRAEMGMGPLSEQIELMYKKYPFDTDKSKIN